VLLTDPLDADCALFRVVFVVCGLWLCCLCGVWVVDTVRVGLALCGRAC